MTTNRCSESFTLASGEVVQCTRKAAPQRDVAGHEAVCYNCFDAWMMENEHSDEGHDEPVADCPVCGTYDPRRRKGHTNTAAHARGSHAACYAANEHPATPAGRAACRKARRDAQLDSDADLIEDMDGDGSDFEDDLEVVTIDDV